MAGTPRVGNASARRWKRPSRRLRVLVDLALSELCQRLVGFLFLGKRRLQQLYGLVHSKPGRPGL